MGRGALMALKYSLHLLVAASVSAVRTESLICMHPNFWRARSAAVCGASGKTCLHWVIAVWHGGPEV
jgi:hypothetical protein